MSKNPEKNIEPESTPSAEDMRLNKYVAHCGICSRRKADEHIQRGVVAVNGQTIKEPGYRVQKGDEVTFKGKTIRPEEQQVYLLLNKPKDTITTVSDEKGRRTVMDLVGGKVEQRVYPVGRLDRNTTGLLLLTNDGELAKKLSHPSYEVQKVYHVFLDKKISQKDLEAIRKGLELDDGLAQVDAVNYIVDAPQSEVLIELHIGRNRIVRRIFEHLGYSVKKLDRVYYAGLTKKDLPRGRFRHLTRQEVIMLKHFV